MHRDKMLTDRDLITLKGDACGTYPRHQGKNRRFQKNIENLTAVSMAESNEYISLISHKLSDKNKQPAVSTSERPVIEA
jgi:hypothetical protein